MIYVDSLNFSPLSNIEVLNDADVTFTLHKGCMTSYLTINKELKIKLNNSDDDAYKMPNALQIPCYLTDKLANILADSYQTKILIGSGGIYISYNLKQ